MGIGGWRILLHSIEYLGMQLWVWAGPWVVKLMIWKLFFPKSTRMSRSLTVSFPISPMSIWKIKSRFCFNIRQFQVLQDGFRYNQREIAKSRSIQSIAIFTPIAKNMVEKPRENSEYFGHSDAYFRYDLCLRRAWWAGTDISVDKMLILSRWKWEAFGA